MARAAGGGEGRASRLGCQATMIEDLKQKLHAEVERLNHELNFVLPKEIDKARQHGDLRENSEYKAALERQQFTVARLSHLRARLGKLSNVSSSDIPRDRVGFGSRVTVQDLDSKQTETYALTLGEFIEGGEDDSEMPVSMASPLGKALLGAKVGQKVDIALPAGRRRLKVTVLETVHDIAEGARPGTSKAK
jgi:transcription elongation factor GreA